MDNKKISNLSILLIGSVATLFVAPLIDEWVSKDKPLTALSTLFFAGWIIFKLGQFVLSWRDDENKWTLDRAKSKIQMYWEILRDFIYDIRKQNITKILVLLGLGLLLKALPNVSAVIRKLLESIFGKIVFLRDFEQFGNTTKTTNANVRIR
jgi:hypothetical protein